MNFHIQIRNFRAFSWQFVHSSFALMPLLMTLKTLISDHRIRFDSLFKLEKNLWLPLLSSLHLFHHLHFKSFNIIPVFLGYIKFVYQVWLTFFLLISNSINTLNKRSLFHDICLLLTTFYKSFPLYSALKISFSFTLDHFINILRLWASFFRDFCLVLNLCSKSVFSLIFFQFSLSKSSYLLLKQLRLLNLVKHFDGLDPVPIYITCIFSFDSFDLL